MMANYFNPYMPTYPTQPPAVPQASPVPQPTGGSMIWVQGESGAKSFITPPNTTVLLMNSEADQFFIKSVDASGMPSPLRVFNYTEVTSTPNVTYVTREEFDEFKASMSKPSRKAKSDEQSV